MANCTCLLQGILDARARQALSQLVFWVFVPALVFTKLAGSVNLKDLGVWCDPQHTSSQTFTNLCEKGFTFA